ncbi:hypothetical protein T10_4962 [Trichinella papuae]|uniref:Uncharacterized protein n=1 Tax=Trichinella papuae TaxID=268474 RepID=A0A0V1MEC9_9BILA|nr:hypothetical protein T10_4962 [Trichinella papuae]
MPKRLCNGREQHERARCKALIWQAISINSLTACIDLTLTSQFSALFQKIDDIDSRVQIYASRKAAQNYKQIIIQQLNVWFYFAYATFILEILIQKIHMIVPLNLSLKYFKTLKIEKVQEIYIILSLFESVGGFLIDFIAGKVMLMMMMMLAMGCLLQAFGSRSRSPAN